MVVRSTFRAVVDAADAETGAVLPNVLCKSRGSARHSSFDQPLSCSLGCCTDFCRQDRPFSEDLRTMLCAENLVLAGSSLGKLFLHHARAKRFFVPADCDATLLGATNLTAFCSYRPEVEVGRLAVS